MTDRRVYSVTCEVCKNVFGTPYPMKVVVCQDCRAAYNMRKYRAGLRTIDGATVIRGSRGGSAVVVVDDPNHEFDNAQFPPHEFVDTLKHGFWPCGMVIKFGNVVAKVAGRRLERINE